MSPVLIVVIVVVVLGVAIAIFGWDRYRGHSGAETGYRPTEEVFDDPQTGKRMRVWYDPASGRRDYRPE